MSCRVGRLAVAKTATLVGREAAMLAVDLGGEDEAREDEEEEGGVRLCEAVSPGLPETASGSGESSRGLADGLK